MIFLFQSPKKAPKQLLLFILKLFRFLRSLKHLISKRFHSNLNFKTFWDLNSIVFFVNFYKNICANIATKP